jgi:hypothetical protein
MRLCNGPNVFDDMDDFISSCCTKARDVLCPRLCRAFYILIFRYNCRQARGRLIYPARSSPGRRT